MALEYLTSGATDMNDGSWIVAAGTPGSGFAAGGTFVVSSGNQTITGRDYSASANNLLSMRIEKPFTGNIGTAAAPLICTFTDGSTSSQKTSANTEGYFYYGAGGGTCFLKADSTGAASINDTFDNLIIDTAGFCGWIGGTAVFLDLINGTCQVNAAGSVTTANVRNGTLTIDAKSSGANVTTLNVYGGTVFVSRPVVTINVYGGTVIMSNTTTTATTTVNQYGGNVIWLSGDITTINQYQGAFDFSGLQRASTFTTWNRGPLATRKGTLLNGQLTVTNDIAVPISGAA